MDSTYHVRTNVSVRRGTSFEALAYKVNIRERFLFFSLVCAFKKAIKNFEVNVDVQKGALKF